MTTGADQAATDQSGPDQNGSEGSTDRQEEVFDFVLGGPARYTRDELIERAGFDYERAKKLWQAMGFPQAEDDARAFTDKDLRALEVAKELQDSGLIDERLMLVLARAMAQTLSRLADANVAAYVDYLTEQAGSDGRGAEAGEAGEAGESNDS